MICPHNEQVICDSTFQRDCRRCGWNPEEHRRRVEKLSTRDTVFGPNNLGRHVSGEEKRRLKMMIYGGFYNGR